MFTFTVKTGIELIEGCVFVYSLICAQQLANVRVCLYVYVIYVVMFMKESEINQSKDGDGNVKDSENFIKNV